MRVFFLQKQHFITDAYADKLYICLLREGTTILCNNPGQRQIALL